ncbi:MAG: tRNA (5-methylaminomethyl-2-thiouridine)(34)-methyltransferase MnmD [Bacteroidota bacterium]
MSEPVSILRTADGSTTLFNSELKETYHSKNGAISESLHVFLQAGLEYRAGIDAAEPLRIYEVGFGTGLNACLTRRWAEENRRSVIYHTIESRPLSEQVWSFLEFPGIPGGALEELHGAHWDEPVKLSDRFTLFKKHGSFLDAALPSGGIDVVYFDAFAPGKQPEMWQPHLLSRVASAMAPGGVLVTYCAQGQFKRDLASAGFAVEALPGPVGKREMVRGVRFTD